ncbi:MAG: endonuclease/exonuclease/phosphatase family protein, partial [Sphingobacteriaceae bacterium]|nr:endonuclease/exonuclease/phosphatase family protein [Cytophagaceae bacterium]
MKPRPRQRGRLASLLSVLTILLGLYTLGVYALSYTLWVKHWLAGFLMLSLPVAMAGLVLAFVYWLVVWPVRAWFPLLVLGLGWPFWQRTLAWHSAHESLKGQTSLRVMSYNLRYFDVEAYTEQAQTDLAPRMVDWVTHFDADIKCFQEFYNRDDPDFPAVFRTKRRLEQAGYHHSIVLKPPSSTRTGQDFVGIAIFSRYPLIPRAEKVFSANGNGYLVADLVRG